MTAASLSTSMIVPWRDAGTFGPGFQFTAEGHTPANGEENPHGRLRIVAPGFFSVLGVPPALGRGFRPEEDAVPGRDAVAVLSYGIWKSVFGSDPSVLGKAVRLNGAEFTVVGVAPERFSGMDQFIRPAVFLPMNALPFLAGDEGRGRLHNRDARGLSVKGRLGPGVSVKAAEAELTAIAQGLADAYPTTNRSQAVLVRTEMQARIERFDLTKNDHVIGCPLCLHSIPTPSPVLESASNQPADNQR